MGGAAGVYFDQRPDVFTENPCNFKSVVLNYIKVKAEFV